MKAKPSTRFFLRHGFLIVHDPEAGDPDDPIDVCCNCCCSALIIFLFLGHCSGYHYMEKPLGG